MYMTRSSVIRSAQTVRTPNQCIGAGIAITYVAAAEIGFRAAFVAEQVTTVWAPTGIAIASLLIWGPRLWPAIWLGAFAVNAATNAPLWTAFVVATGNTLEAVLATCVLRRVPQFDFSFRRVTDVLTFIGIAVVASPVGQRHGRYGDALCSWRSVVATLCAVVVRLVARRRARRAGRRAGDPHACRRSEIAAAGRPDSSPSFVSASLIVTHLAFSPLFGLGAHAARIRRVPRRDCRGVDRRTGGQRGGCAGDRRP